MTKREVVKKALKFDNPPYVPWNFSFTLEAAEKVKEHYADDDLNRICDNHFVSLGDSYGFFEDTGNDRFRDYFGAVWDRSQDKDIGVIEGQVLPEPTLSGYDFPDPHSDIIFGDMQKRIDARSDCFRFFTIGFSLYERAWTLRGMETLMTDFVRELLHTIADYNIAQVEKALEYDIDAVHFGDDWGQQHGLIMGPAIWHEFIYPELRRMYKTAKDAGKFVSIHSCGDVDELFGDLVDIGLNVFNPFQPEVMDVHALMRQYKGKLAFFGGISTQRTLPYGTCSDVAEEATRMMELGSGGGYILAPAHAVEGDVPVENIVVLIDKAKSQPGYNALL